MLSDSGKGGKFENNLRAVLSSFRKIEYLERSSCSPERNDRDECRETIMHLENV
jgi:hypothetical protein